MKKVLFVCVGNSARSQMAEGFFNHLAGGRARGLSAGTAPAGEVAPLAVAVMKEIGIDISSQRPKPITQKMVAGADKIISMGCGVAETCPVVIGMRIDEDWALADPYGQPIEKMREIREEIGKRVRLLLEQLDLPQPEG